MILCSRQRGQAIVFGGCAVASKYRISYSSIQSSSCGVYHISLTMRFALSIASTGRGDDVAVDSVVLAIAYRSRYDVDVRNTVGWRSIQYCTCRALAIPYDGNRSIQYVYSPRWIRFVEEQ